MPWSSLIEPNRLEFGLSNGMSISMTTRKVATQKSLYILCAQLFVVNLLESISVSSANHAARLPMKYRCRPATISSEDFYQDQMSSSTPSYDNNRVLSWQSVEFVPFLFLCAWHTLQTAGMSTKLHPCATYGLLYGLVSIAYAVVNMISQYE